MKTTGIKATVFFSEQTEYQILPDSMGFMKSSFSVIFPDRLFVNMQKGTKLGEKQTGDPGVPLIGGSI